MTTLYVGNLPFSATEAEIRSLFELHGTVESVKIINDRETGRPLRLNEARERAPRPPRSGGGARW